MTAQVLVALALLPAAVAAAESRVSVTVRGKEQTLHVYGPKDGPPAVVASGDGGWIHLGPYVAELLASRGYFVVGVDSKAYLSSFTSGTQTLAPADVPGDFRVFVDYARQGRGAKTPLVGVSEGAGLSVLAASDPGLQPALAGVLGLGLPNVNELGWRFRDQMIYITKKAPKEPTFNAADYVPKLGGVPLAAIHSTHDEYVPLDEVKTVLAAAGPPRRLWIVEAADHRFSNNTKELDQRVLEALEWMKAGGR